MLTHLAIRDIVLIEKLDLSLDEGLGVLSGETGAGKSILLDALGLALGARGDASLVRSGCDKGSVTAMFSPPAGHRAFELLAEAEVDAEEGTIVVRRVQQADGKSRAFINDQPASVTLLRQLGAYAAAAAQIFPDRPVETAILWTATGQLMPVPTAVPPRGSSRKASSARPARRIPFSTWVA